MGPGMAVAGMSLQGREVSSWAEAWRLGSGSEGGASFYPARCMGGRVSSWLRLMIPAARITQWWEQVANMEWAEWEGAL